MVELAVLKSDLNGAFRIEMLEDFEFDEELVAKLVLSIIYSFSSMLDKDQNKEQFQAEVFRMITEDLADGGLENTMTQT